MAPQARVVFVVEKPEVEHCADEWLASKYKTIKLQRGPQLVPDIVASSPDILILEAVHLSEALWLAEWLRIYPRIAEMPLIFIVPFGPAPKYPGPILFLVKPLGRARLIKSIRTLLSGRSER